MPGREMDFKSVLLEALDYAVALNCPRYAHFSPNMKYNNYEFTFCPLCPGSM